MPKPERDSDEAKFGGEGGDGGEVPQLKTGSGISSEPMLLRTAKRITAKITQFILPGEFIFCWKTARSTDHSTGNGFFKK